MIIYRYSINLIATGAKYLYFHYNFQALKDVDIVSRSSAFCQGPISQQNDGWSQWTSCFQYVCVKEALWWLSSNVSSIAELLNGDAIVIVPTFLESGVR